MTIELAELLATVINSSLGVIAQLRRQGMTNDQLNARLDAIDAGAPGITADEIQGSLDAWQEQINAGRRIV